MSEATPSINKTHIITANQYSHKAQCQVKHSINVKFPPETLKKIPKKETNIIDSSTKYEKIIKKSFFQSNFPLAYNNEKKLQRFVTFSI